MVIGLVVRGWSGAFVISATNIDEVVILQRQFLVDKRYGME